MAVASEPSSLARWTITVLLVCALSIPDMLITLTAVQAVNTFGLGLRPSASVGSSIEVVTVGRRSPFEDNRIFDALDWRTGVNTQANKSLEKLLKPKHQGTATRTCWAFASVAAVEALYGLSDVDVDIDINALIACQEGCCENGSPEQALATMRDRSAVKLRTNLTAAAGYNCRQGCQLAPKVQDIDSSYCSPMASHLPLPPEIGDLASPEFVRVHNSKALMQALAVQPVVVQLDATTWEEKYVAPNYTRDNFIYSSRTCGNSTNHAVLAVGYKQPGPEGPGYWVLMNSWGRDWGPLTDGFMYLEMNATLDQVGGPCGMLTQRPFLPTRTVSLNGQDPCRQSYLCGAPKVCTPTNSGNYTSYRCVCPVNAGQAEVLPCDDSTVDVCGTRFKGGSSPCGNNQTVIDEVLDNLYCVNNEGSPEGYYCKCAGPLVNTTLASDGGPACINPLAGQNASCGAAGYQLYTVKPGDTCWVIWTRAGMSSSGSDFYQQNPGIDCSVLKVGQRLCIFAVPRSEGACLSPEAGPGAQLYTVQEGDTCWLVWNRAQMTEALFYTLNPGVECNSLQVGLTKLCIRPPPLAGSCPPGTSAYTVQPGDICYDLWTARGMTSADFYTNNPDVVCNALVPGTTDVCLAPARGVLPPTASCPLGTVAHTVQNGELCYNFWTSLGYLSSQFFTDNPRVNCQFLQAGVTVVCLRAARAGTCPAGTSAYTVIEGDTCYALAQSTASNVAQLTTDNPNVSCDNLAVGSALCLRGTPSPGSLPPSVTCAPGTSAYTIEAGEICYDMYTADGTTANQFYSDNPGLDCYNLQAGTTIVCRRLESPAASAPLATRLAPASATCPPGTTAYTVQDGDICYDMYTADGTTAAQFAADNPGVSCLALQAGVTVVCRR